MAKKDNKIIINFTYKVCDEHTYIGVLNKTKILPFKILSSSKPSDMIIFIEHALNELAKTNKLPIEFNIVQDIFNEKHI